LALIFFPFADNHSGTVGRDTNSWYCAEVKVVMCECSSVVCSVFSSVTSLVTVVKVLEDGEEGFDTLSALEETSRFPNSSDE